MGAPAAAVAAANGASASTAGMQGIPGAPADSSWVMFEVNGFKVSLTSQLRADSNYKQSSASAL
jgi:hypothetical protein